MPINYRMEPKEFGQFIASKFDCTVCELAAQIKDAGMSDVKLSRLANSIARVIVAKKRQGKYVTSLKIIKSICRYFCISEDLIPEAYFKQEILPLYSPHVAELEEITVRYAEIIRNLKEDLVSSVDEKYQERLCRQLENAIKVCENATTLLVRIYAVKRPTIGKLSLH